MPSARHIATYLGLLFLTVEAVPLAAQTEKEEEEIKLNEDVIKMIQFDFAPKENPYKPLNSSLDKKWMQFKEDTFHATQHDRLYPSKKNKRIHPCRTLHHLD